MNFNISSAINTHLGAAEVIIDLSPLPTNNQSIYKIQSSSCVDNHAVKNNSKVHMYLNATISCYEVTHTWLHIYSLHSR